MNFNPDASIKYVKGYEGLYYITSCGHVWSIQNKKFIAEEVTSSLKIRVELYKNGKREHRYIHNLVAEAYLENPDNLPEVDHLKHECGQIPSNNVNNLRWVEKVINCCNRENSIPVFNVMTNKHYCTIAMAERETGKTRRAIQKMCNTFHDEHTLQEFIYVEDFIEYDLHKRFYHVRDYELGRKIV